MTLAELLAKLGYDHVTPQPALYNAEIVCEFPGDDPREEFKTDFVLKAGDKIHIHMK